MPTEWKILIDWDRNGDFAGTYDDVTQYVAQANWFLGFRKPYQEMSDNALLTLILINTDKRFSPENPSSPLYGDMLCRSA